MIRGPKWITQCCLRPRHRLDGRTCRWWLRVARAAMRLEYSALQSMIGLGSQCKESFELWKVQEAIFVRVCTCEKLSHSFQHRGIRIIGRHVVNIAHGQFALARDIPALENALGEPQWRCRLCCTRLHGARPQCRSESSIVSVVSGLSWMECHGRK